MPRIVRCALAIADRFRLTQYIKLVLIDQFMSIDVF
jgi:hypothetical protein